jgi:hypothetical protein
MYVCLSASPRLGMAANTVGALVRALLPPHLTRTPSAATATPRSESGRYHHKRDAAALASEDGSSRDQYYD